MIPPIAHEQSPKRILVVRLGAVGDLVRTLPAVQLLRQTWPDAKIGWVVQDHCAPLLEGHPYLDRLIVFHRDAFLREARTLRPKSLGRILALRREMRDFEPDLVLDFQGCFKSGLAAWLSGAPLRVGFNKAHVREWSHLFANVRVPLADEDQHRVLRAMALARAAGAGVATDAEQNPVIEGERTRARSNSGIGLNGTAAANGHTQTIAKSPVHSNGRANGQAALNGDGRANGSSIASSEQNGHATAGSANNGSATAGQSGIQIGSTGGPGVFCEQGVVDLGLTREELQAGRARIDTLSDGLPAVAIAPFSSGRQAWKRFPIDAWRAIARDLADAGYAVLVLAGPGEETEARNLAREAGALVVPCEGAALRELAATLSYCRLLVGGDTGPMHMAWGVGTPVVALYGPTCPLLNAPFGKGHVTLAPARRTGRDDRDKFPGISTARIVEAALSLLEGQRRPHLLQRTERALRPLNGNRADDCVNSPARELPTASALGGSPISGPEGAHLASS